MQKALIREEVGFAIVSVQLGRVPTLTSLVGSDVPVFDLDLNGGQELEMLNTAFCRCPADGLLATTSNSRLTRSAPDESTLDR
jgi:hypothetical protein